MARTPRYTVSLTEGQTLALGACAELAHERSASEFRHYLEANPHREDDLRAVVRILQDAEPSQTPRYSVPLTRGQLKVLRSLTEMTCERATETFGDWLEANPQMEKTLRRTDRVLRKAWASQ